MKGHATRALTCCCSAPFFFLLFFMIVNCSRVMIPRKNACTSADAWFRRSFSASSFTLRASAIKPSALMVSRSSSTFSKCSRSSPNCRCSLLKPSSSSARWYAFSFTFTSYSLMTLSTSISYLLACFFFADSSSWEPRRSFWLDSFRLLIFFSSSSRFASKASWCSLILVSYRVRSAFMRSFLDSLTSRRSAFSFVRISFRWDWARSHSRRMWLRSLSSCCRRLLASASLLL
mmetsp:Transcript_4015/g.11420  ORF Transcript_4015/g.11420 Transcript_4015/m.11420 type:complete len:232 (-) Transcript_4015:610-1305(-)